MIDTEALSEYASTIDADQINSRFFAPFQGMKEMYALQKGLEIGVELGAKWQSAQQVSEHRQMLSWLRDGIEHFNNDEDQGQREHLIQAIDRVLNPLAQLADKAGDGNG